VWCVCKGADVCCVVCYVWVCHVCGCGVCVCCVCVGVCVVVCEWVCCVYVRMCVWVGEISLIASFPHSIVSVPPSKREKGRSGVLVFRSELDKHHSANCTGRSWCKEVLAHYFIMDVPHVDIKLHCLSLPLLLC